MTYPSLAKIDAGLLSPVDAHKGAGGEPGARANRRNLIGFLDAFKAISPLSTALGGANVPSLTHCEDFA
jgi:hypothetical protein